jgi:hypothetical protein
MVSPLLRLIRDSVNRSRERNGRTHSAVFSPVVETLEGRRVLSSLHGLGPDLAGPIEAQSAPAAIQASAANGFTPMFNGTSTAGWFIPYDWGRAYAKSNEILLIGDKDFFLVSQKTYKNFILEADARIPSDGNSGIQFRTQYGHNSIEGYQADVDTAARNWAGGLWDQARGWLVRARPHAPVVAGQWNHYTVEAIGDHIRIFVNGVLTVDVHNALHTDGHIALQDHGSKGEVYEFKNVRIEDLGG